MSNLNKKVVLPGKKKKRSSPPPDSRSSTSTTTSSTSYGALHGSFSGQPSSQSGQDIREPLLGKEKERQQPSERKLSDKLLEEAKKQAEIEAYEEFVKEAKRTDFQTDIEYTLKKEKQRYDEYLKEHPSGRGVYSRKLINLRLEQIKIYQEALNEAIVFENEVFIETAYDKIERVDSPWLWNAFHIKIGEEVERLRKGKLTKGTYGEKPIKETLGAVLKRAKARGGERSVHGEVKQLEAKIDKQKIEIQEAVKKTRQQGEEKLAQRLEEKLMEKLEEKIKQRLEEGSQGSPTKEGGGEKPGSQPPLREVSGSEPAQTASSHNPSKS